MGAYLISPTAQAITRGKSLAPAPEGLQRDKNPQRCCCLFSACNFLIERIHHTRAVLFDGYR